jgi:type III restriction protein res subunit
VHLYLPYFDAQTVEDVVKALQSTEGGEIPTDVIGDSFENSTIETWTVRPTRSAPAQRPARPKQQVPGQMSLGDSPSPETGNEPSAQEATQQTPSQSGSTSFGAPAAPASGTTDTIRPVSGVSSETPANGAAAGAEPSGATEPQPAPEDVPEEPELDREAIVKAINDAGLLTYDVRRIRINDYLKSLFSLTRLLTQSGLQPSASYDVVNEIVEMIRSFIKKTKDEGRYDELATQVLQFKLKTQTFDVFGESVDDHAEMDLFSTTDTDLDRQFRLAELKLGNEGIGIRYGTRYADDDNPAGYKIDVIIFAADADCMDMLHNYARSRFHDINDANRRRITGLTERYRKKYDSIVSDGDIISKHNFRLPETISIERSNVGEAYTDHLFVDNATGKAVINLNNWEKAVLQAERGRSDYICWLRNPPRKSWSLCIPYEQNAEKKSMYPDFLIIRKDEMGFVIDILEPHDGTRTDNLGKAKGFAEYARQNPGVGRLQLIRLLNGRIKRLDMSRSAVRDRVSHAMSNDELDHIFDEDGFFG